MEGQPPAAKLVRRRRVSVSEASVGRASRLLFVVQCGAEEQNGCGGVRASVRSGGASVWQMLVVEAGTHRQQLVCLSLMLSVCECS